MKTVLITGGSRGIGAACAREFKKAGYNTVIGYLSRKDLAESLAKEIAGLAVKLDVTSMENIIEAVNNAKALYGKIDTLVNCAGIALKQGVIGSYSQADYENVFSVNVKGIIDVTNAVLPDMLSLGRGSIVNVSSIWGLDGGACESIYSASKGAVTALTKSLAKELAPSNIRVNEVAPGFIDTDMNSHLSKKEKKEFCKAVCLNRIGKAEEVAMSVKFLSGDEASYITGQTIRVDGGVF